MKLFVLVVCVCFLEMCLSSPTATSEKPSGLSSSDLQKMHDILTGISGLSSETADRFTSIMSKMQAESDDEKATAMMQLTSLAVQGDDPDLKPVDLKQKLIDASAKNEDKKIESDDEGLTDKVLEKMQEKFCEVLTQRQCEHAMKIYRGFRVGATEEEKNAASRDLMSSAMSSMMRGATIAE